MYFQEDARSLNVDNDVKREPDTEVVNPDPNKRPSLDDGIPYDSGYMTHIQDDLENSGNGDDLSTMPCSFSSPITINIGNGPYSCSTPNHPIRQRKSSVIHVNRCESPHDRSFTVSPIHSYGTSSTSAAGSYPGETSSSSIYHADMASSYPTRPRSRSHPIIRNPTHVMVGSQLRIIGDECEEAWNGSGGNMPVNANQERRRHSVLDPLWNFWYGRPAQENEDSVPSTSNGTLPHN